MPFTIWQRFRFLCTFIPKGLIHLCGTRSTADLTEPYSAQIWVSMNFTLVTACYKANVFRGGKFWSDHCLPHLCEKTRRLPLILVALPLPGGSTALPRRPSSRLQWICNCCWRYVCRAYWSSLDHAALSLTTGASRAQPRTVTTAASRSYFDRNGVEIVTNRPSPTVVARADVAEDYIKLQILLTFCSMLAVRGKIMDTSDGASSTSHGF